jgi:NAD(P)H-dependent FMN reductase
MTGTVLIISGSVGRRSRTRTLLKVVAAGCKLQGLDPVWYDLGEHDLGIADPAYHFSTDRHPNAEVRALSALATRSVGFVIGSPVYHNSYTGVLKNCLDHLTIRHFEGKPVAIACHGGTMRSMQPADQLRLVIRGLHGIATVNQVVSADTDFVARDGGLAVTNPKLFDRIARLVAELDFLIARLAPQHGERRDLLWTPEEEDAPSPWVLGAFQGARPASNDFHAPQQDKAE